LPNPDRAAIIAGKLTRLSERQWRDYRARQPGTCFADADLVLSLEEAYELQSAVAALRVAAGDRLIGYKVGCTGPGTVAQFGMAGPIRGYLFASEVHPNGIALDSTAFARPAIEGEMAILIGEGGEIAATFPIIELHHLIFRAPRKTLVELVANNGLNAGIVLSEAKWRSARAVFAPSARFTVLVNEQRVGSGGLWPLPGGPTASIDWLRQHLAEFGLSLNPGQIVLAGTPLGLYPVEPGDRIAVLIDDEPAVYCSFA